MTTDDDRSSGQNWNLRDPSVLLATGFGIGLIPVAPGTWGSLFAVLVAWEMFGTLGMLGLALGAIGAFGVGVRVSGDCIRKYESQDPKQVVIDEIAGQWLVLLVAGHNMTHYALAFVLFRIFDILKPWPVSWADREIKGGLGVMVDDVLAGLYAAAVLFAMIQWMGV
ncbi:MAG: phosphatidylglycerophosphatase A [Rhodospirillales bacterium]|nr:phosphatidylglycerophosphatase A [Rhodospirillales bacterium]